jgi:hypothetical protein
MADTIETGQALNDAALDLAKKATEARSSLSALQFAYAAGALACAAQGVPFAASYAQGG